MGLDCFDSVPDINIHQAYLDFVVADDLALAQDPEIHYINAVKRLEDIRDELAQCPNAREEILDYYCQDVVFSSIVGSYDRYNALCRYLDTNTQEQSTESVSASIPFALGLLLGTLKEVENKTLYGMKQVADSIQSKNEIKIYDERCRYAIPKDQMMKACKLLNEAISYMEKCVQNPKAFNVKQAMDLSSKLGIPIDSPNTLEKLGAGFKGTLLGFLKTIPHALLYGGLAVLISIATFGWATVPAGVMADILIGSKLVSNITKTYKNSLNKKADRPMGYIGWTPDAFKEFAKQFSELAKRAQNLKTIAAINETNVKNVAPNTLAQFAGFLKLTLAALKGMGKCLVAMADTANI